MPYRTTARFIGALLIAAAPALAAPAAQAAVAHVRGTIVSFADGVLTIRQGDSTEAIGVASTTRVTGIAPAQLSDIGPGTYVGAAALPEAGGHLRALEVHIFPTSLRGAGEGYRPMPGTQPDQTMTNGTVGTVSGTSGTQLTVSYNGGTQTLEVPPGTPIVRLDPGTTALLTPGASVSLFADDASGKPVAQRISVGENGVVPPL
jgi:hypothetical protein